MTSRRESLPTVRPAARVLLLDHDDRLLLFRGQDPAEPEVRFWFPPGGGIEPGETPEQAARRELREETGLVDVRLGPKIGDRRHLLWFDGVHIDARETWFMARVPPFEVDTSGFTEVEKRVVPEHRWWTLSELWGTRDLLTPRTLPRLVAGLLADGPPPSPVTIPV